MSSLKEAIEIASDARRFGYAVAGLYTFQLYEWILMLGDEISFIHPAPWTTAKLGYLLCRYYPLAVWPTIVYTGHPDRSQESCSRLVRPVNVLLIPLQLFPQGMMFMRAYAFTCRRKAILATLLPIYLALAALSIWTIGTEGILTWTPFGASYETGCFAGGSERSRLASMGAVLCTAVFMDLICFIIVLARAIQKQTLDSRLVKICVYQGLCNFGIVLTINAGAAGIYFRSINHHDGIGLALSLVLTNVVAGRMILTLRQRTSPTNTEIDRQYSKLVREGLGPQTRRPDPWAIQEHIE